MNKKKIGLIILSLMLAIPLVFSLKVTDAYSEVIHGDGWTGYTGADASSDMNSAFMQDFLKDIVNSDVPIIWNGVQYGTDGSVTPAETPAVPQTETPQPVSTPAPKKECSHEYATEITKEATCKEEGELKMTCKHCGEEKTEVIPKSDEHDYIFLEAGHEDASCNKEGKDVYECSVCGEKYEEVIPKTEHEYEITKTVDATCIEKGMVTYSCKTCGESYVEETEELGHDEGTWKTVTEKGIFKDGLEVRECNRCGEKLEERVIPSRYPYYYQYILYGGAAFIVILFVLLALIKKKKHR